MIPNCFANGGCYASSCSLFANTKARRTTNQDQFRFPKQADAWKTTKNIVIARIKVFLPSIASSRRQGENSQSCGEKQGRSTKGPAPSLSPPSSDPCTLPESESERVSLLKARALMALQTGLPSPFSNRHLRIFGVLGSLPAKAVAPEIPNKVCSAPAPILGVKIPSSLP